MPAKIPFERLVEAVTLYESGRSITRIHVQNKTGVTVRMQIVAAKDSEVVAAVRKIAKRKSPGGVIYKTVDDLERGLFVLNERVKKLEKLRRE